MIDPANLPHNLRAAMDRRPALVPPVSAGAFLRATKANPMDARNAAKTSDKRCRHLEMNIRGNCVACGKQIYIMRLDQSAGIAAQLAETAPSCPPETKSVESVTRFKCTVCGRLTVGRIPKGGNGTFRYPAQHFIGGTLCRGVHDEAEWVDVPRKSPRSCDPLPVSCPPEPVRVARGEGKAYASMLTIPVKPRRATAMNRTETALFEILKEKFPSCVIQWEKYTLRLARKTSYTPDFSIFHPSGGGLEFWEAKGAFIRDKAMVKPKIAAELFRGQHKFTLAQKKKTGWVFSEL